MLFIIENSHQCLEASATGLLYQLGLCKTAACFPYIVKAKYA
jgi:hypothetical protein